MIERLVLQIVADAPLDRLYQTVVDSVLHEDTIGGRHRSVLCLGICQRAGRPSVARYQRHRR